MTTTESRTIAPFPGLLFSPTTPRAISALQTIAGLVAAAALMFGCSVELPGPASTSPPGLEGVVDILDGAADADGDVGNQPPVIVSIEADATMLSPGGTAVVTLQVEDPDGDVLQSTWDVSSAAWGLNNTSTFETTVTAPDVGGEVVRVSVVVQDPSMATDTAEIELQTEGVPCEDGFSHCFGDAQCLPTKSGVSEACAGRSCLDILVNAPGSTTGVYWVQPEAGGDTVELTCDMETAGGGWTRLEFLQTEEEADCPDGFNWASNQAICRRDSNGIARYEVDSLKLEWSQVRVRLSGFVRESADAVENSDAAGPESIDGDGVFFSVGNPPMHLWGYYIGHGSKECPCNGGSEAPDFLKEFWSCQKATGTKTNEFYLESQSFNVSPFTPNTCDLPDRPAVFERTLEATTAEPVALELRLNEDRSNEDFGVDELEVFVREHEVCDNLDNDHDGLVDEAGACPVTTERSCWEIKQSSDSSGGFLTDGEYWISLNGTATRVYCDMSNQGGGWTLLAVCRQFRGGECYDNNRIGDVLTPDSVQTAKLSDDEIRAVLSVGEMQTRALWRQGITNGNPGAVSAVTFNQFADPSGVTSDQCDSNDRELSIKHLGTNSASWNSSWIALADQAWALDWDTDNTNDSDGNCDCAASGWSNSGHDSCGNAVEWRAECEGGPTMSDNCGVSAEERANVILWGR